MKLEIKHKYFEYILCLCVVAAYGVVAGWYKIVDNDFYWHLKCGQVMIETGSVLKTNTLSTYFANYPWEDFAWLFQVVMAFIFNLGGWLGLIVVKVMLVALLGAMLYRICILQGTRPVVAAAIAVGLLSVIRFRFTERPDFISLVFFCATILIVEYFRKKNFTKLWVLIPLFVVWSNMHSGLLFALIYIFGVAAVELALSKTPHGDFERGKKLALIGVLCAVASLANPFGYKVILFPFLASQSDKYIEIKEFNAPTFAAFPLFYVMGGLAAASFATTKKRDYAAFALSLVFIVGGVVFLRLIPYAAIACATVIAASTVETAWKESLKMATTLSVWVAFSAYAGYWTFSGSDRTATYIFGYGPEESVYPKSAAEFALRENLPQNIYNHYNYGGYLAYKLYPKYGVFQDGRNAVPLEFVYEFNKGHGSMDWTASFKKYNVNTILDSTENIQFLLKDKENWAFVYFDSEYSILVRKSATPPEVLQKLEYRYYNPFVGLSKVITPENILEVEGEVLRNFRENSKPYWKNYVDMAYVQLRKGNPVEVEKLLSMSEKYLDNAGYFALGEAGLGWLQLGRKDKAMPLLKRSVAINPGQPYIVDVLQKLGATH